MDVSVGTFWNLYVNQASPFHHLHDFSAFSITETESSRPTLEPAVADKEGSDLSNDLTWGPSTPFVSIDFDQAGFRGCFGGGTSGNSSPGKRGESDLSIGSHGGADWSYASWLRCHTSTSVLQEMSRSLHLEGHTSSKKMVPTILPILHSTWKAGSEQQAVLEILNVASR